MKHGQGTGREAGDHYSGAWYEDEAHGMGVLTKANGEVLRGEFENDEFIDSD